MGRAGEKGMRLTKEQLSDIWNKLQFDRETISKLFNHIDALEAEIATHKAETAAMLTELADMYENDVVNQVSAQSVARTLLAAIPTDYAVALEEHDAEIVKPMLALIEKWDVIISAFTSDVYTVIKPMNAVQVLKDARFDLETAITEALK